jgi:endoglucanase
MEADLAAVRGNFTDIPLVIGEWSASPQSLDSASRWKYYDYFTRLAVKYSTVPILWDNGNDQLDRAAHTFRDPVAVDIHMNALKGVKNTLPESTTDGAATTQSSSAYIYHKANTSVTAQTLGFELNGNTLTSIKTSAGKALVAGTDYTVSGKDVSFTSAFLSTLFTPTTAPGTVATFTLAFSAGASLTVTAVQYATPVLGATSSALPATSADLLIPITWAGQARPATVKAIKSDGGILIDDWTQYLPELQKGRLTYSGQWDWDATHVILRAAVLDAVRAAGKTTTFTFEFWPREPGNVANYTITV